LGLERKFVNNYHERPRTNETKKIQPGRPPTVPSFPMRMNLLLTGGAGFIGSHVVEHFITRPGSLA
jgi:hypothetical protein